MGLKGFELHEMHCRLLQSVMRTAIFQALTRLYRSLKLEIIDIIRFLKALQLMVEYIVIKTDFII